jgi:hypothetical protein
MADSVADAPIAAGDSALPEDVDELASEAMDAREDDYYRRQALDGSHHRD